MTQYYSRSLGVGTLTIYDADIAITTIYSMACVGSTLVRYIHSITQEWCEECTSGLFFRLWYFFWCWRCVGLWLWRRGGTYVDDHDAIQSRHPIWIFCVGSATKVPREERKEGKVVLDQQYSNPEVIT